jgi:hypothetical protein
MDPVTSAATVATSAFLVPVYVTYAVIALGLTIGLARVLFRSGAVFLDDVFKETPKMAEAVNRLLVVGFYLLNLGYAALIMKATGANTAVDAAEVLAWKLGALLISLGAMHFFNMYLFFRIRRRSQLAVLPPPVAPQMRLYQAPTAPAAGAPALAAQAPAAWSNAQAAYAAFPVGAP